METKKCYKCKTSKELCFFNSDRTQKDGHENKCKECKKEYDRLKWIRNKSRLTFERKEYLKKYREEHKHVSTVYGREYHKKNKHKRRIYLKNKKKNDPLFKLKHSIGSMILMCLKSIGGKKNRRTDTIVSCSTEELLNHLNTNSYGFKYGDENIDIDHIIPLVRAKTEEDVHRLNHYTNLQLLPSDYNRFVKGDKEWNKNDFEEWLTSYEDKNTTFYL